MERYTLFDVIDGNVLAQKEPSFLYYSAMQHVPKESIGSGE